MENWCEKVLLLQEGLAGEMEGEIVELNNETQGRKAGLLKSPE